MNFYLNYARFKPEEVQYGTREEVLKRKQTENLLVSTPIDMAVGHVTSKIPVKKITSSKFKNPVTRTTTTESRATRKGATVLEEGPESIGNINNRTHSSLNNLHRSTGKKSYTLNSEKSNWKFNSETPKTAVKNSEGNYTLGRETNWNSKGLNLDDSSVRVINADGTSNVPKGTRYITIDKRPYIKNGKQYGRPSFRKGFEQKLYNQYGGIVQDPNTKEIIDWKPGQLRENVVDFGHKPKYKYSDYFKRYKNEEVTPKELRDWYNDPTHYQFEVPLNNKGHKYE